MLTTKKINSLIGVVESYQSSYELEKIMADPAKRISLFREFLKEKTGLSFDWFTDYFQEDEIGKFPIQYHNHDTQEAVANFMKFLSDEDQQVQDEIDGLKMLKSKLMDAMMV